MSGTIGHVSQYRPQLCFDHGYRCGSRQQSRVRYHHGSHWQCRFLNQLESNGNMPLKPPRGFQFWPRSWTSTLIAFNSDRSLWQQLGELTFVARNLKIWPCPSTTGPNQRVGHITCLDKMVEMTLVLCESKRTGPTTSCLLHWVR